MARLTIDATPGAAENIVALYGAGLTMAAVSRATGWSDTGLYRWLRKRGLWRTSRMSAAEHAEIERLYYEGLSVERIAQEIGRTHGGVRYYLQSRDLWLPERTRVTAAMAAKIRAWYDRGVPVAVIGDRLGIHETAIYNHVTPSRVAPLPDDDRRRMVELYQDGAYVIDIARRFGRDHTTVRAVLREAGVYAPGSQPRRVYRAWNT